MSPYIFCSTYLLSPVLNLSDSAHKKIIIVLFFPETNWAWMGIYSHVEFFFLSRCLYHLYHSP